MAMKNNICSFCQRPKASYHCEVCEAQLCKACAQFLDDDSFSFLATKPHELSFTTYCPPCFDQNVAAPLSRYNETMEKAKDVIAFFKDQGQATRLMKRSEAPVTVTNCPDREETLLRLAFLAAQNGFNSILDVEIIHKKVINGSHKALIFSGSAVPFQMDEKQIRNSR